LNHKKSIVTNDIKLLHQNINGLFSKIGSVEVILAEEAPEILCLTEHHMKESQLKVTNLVGYKFNVNHTFVEPISKKVEYVFLLKIILYVLK
jgi:exonuclease III